MSLISVDFLSPKRWGALIPALRHRNYRLFFFGQGASLIGTWMQRVALSWLVYRLTDSEFLLGLVGFSSQILTFALSPFAGVLADRSNRLRLLIATQCVAMIQAFLLAGLTMSHLIEVWHIIALSLMLGLVNAFDIPIRQAFVVEMIESRDDLPNAIALNSFLVNASRLIGPSLAGVIVALMGEGPCFILNGISFVAVIAALLAMRLSLPPRSNARQHVLRTLKEGFAYSFGVVPIRMILILLAFMSVTGISVMVLLPVYARDILHGSSKTLGLMMSVSGVGAIAGTVFMAARNRASGLGRLIAVASAVMGVALIGLSLSRTLPTALGSVMVVGCAMMVMLASCNTFLQSAVDDDKRGRVMSLYTMAFMGMTPFGNLLMGSMAEKLGTAWTTAFGGLCCLAAAAAFASKLGGFPADAPGVASGSDAAGDGHGAPREGTLTPATKE